MRLHPIFLLIATTFVMRLSYYGLDDRCVCNLSSWDMEILEEDLFYKGTLFHRNNRKLDMSFKVKLESSILYSHIYIIFQMQQMLPI